MRQELKNLCEIAALIEADICEEDTGWLYQFKTAIQNGQKVLREYDPAVEKQAALGEFSRLRANAGVTESLNKVACEAWRVGRLFAETEAKK